MTNDNLTPIDPAAIRSAGNLASADEPTPPTTRTAEAPSAPTPTLHSYETGEELRDATGEELAESVEAARHDGGAGVIMADGVRCYVADPCPVALPSGGAS